MKTTLKYIITITIIVLLLSLSNNANATEYLIQSGSPSNLFGADVAISGNIAVIGAPMTNHQYSNSGSAYIYRWNGSTWAEEIQLFANHNDDSQFFGAKVAISEDVVAISTIINRQTPQMQLAVYLFRWNGSIWVREQLLTSNNSNNTFSAFGYSIELFEDTLVVGGDVTADGTNSAVQVFRYNGNLWEHEQELIASDLGPEDSFGASVSINDDRILVSAPNDDVSKEDSGSAYVFRYDGSSWIEEQKLTPSDGRERDQFGFDISINKNIAVISAPDNDDLGSKAGAVYVFRYNGNEWVEDQKLYARDGAAHKRFGSSVSNTGGSLLIGAPGLSSSQTEASVYTFSWIKNSWVETEQVTKLASEAPHFGHSVSISGSNYVVGTDSYGPPYATPGNAFIYSDLKPDTTGNAIEGKSKSMKKFFNSMHDIIFKKK